MSGVGSDHVDGAVTQQVLNARTSSSRSSYHPTPNESGTRASSSSNQFSFHPTPSPNVSQPLQRLHSTGMAPSGESDDLQVPIDVYPLSTGRHMLEQEEYRIQETLNVWENLRQIQDVEVAGAMRHIEILKAQLDRVRRRMN